MKSIDWLNAIGLIVCRRDSKASRDLAEEVEKVAKNELNEQYSVSDKR